MLPPTRRTYLRLSAVLLAADEAEWKVEMDHELDAGERREENV
jgi:hypothetical protein